jgi:hypothetical protein
LKPLTWKDDACVKRTSSLALTTISFSSPFISLFSLNSTSTPSKFQASPFNFFFPKHLTYVILITISFILNNL